MQRWIPLSKIPKDVINAVIVAEDGTFWEHGGFDWFEFRESIERNLKEGRPARGASTITQQLVKNLYLSPSKNPLRKLKEWVLTWYMEQTLSKHRILELYLNVIEWGRGIYGIEVSAQAYFGKSASMLSRDEAARLAAVIPNPRRYRVDKETRYLEQRSQLILSRMAARGPDSTAE
jgi:monofunctional biosynthetic peptidoglycan transglycosylase